MKSYLTRSSRDEALLLAYLLQVLPQLGDLRSQLIPFVDCRRLRRGNEGDSLAQGRERSVHQVESPRHSRARVHDRGNLRRQGVHVPLDRGDGREHVVQRVLDVEPKLIVSRKLATNGAFHIVEGLINVVTRVGHDRVKVEIRGEAGR